MVIGKEEGQEEKRVWRENAQKWQNWRGRRGGGGAGHRGLDLVRLLIFTAGRRDLDSSCLLETERLAANKTSSVNSILYGCHLFHRLHFIKFLRSHCTSEQRAPCASSNRSNLDSDAGTMELRIWCLAAALSRVTCYSPSARSRHRQRPSRREALVALFAPVASGAAAATGRPCAARAQSTTDASVSTLQEATGALSSLLENWEKATVDCTYADVPRELLEAKNKERLLEKVTSPSALVVQRSLWTPPLYGRSCRFAHGSSATLFSESFAKYALLKDNCFLLVQGGH